MSRQLRCCLENGFPSLPQNYSPRRLTEPLDKLPAISSITAYFSDLLASQYLAGLFKTKICGAALLEGGDTLQ